MLELEGGVVIEHVHVELTLTSQTRKGQIAAAQIADDGADWIVSEQQVELGVQGVT